MLVDEPGTSYRLASTNAAIKGFDIIAVCPGNDEKTLMALCKDADCDIISFDFSTRMGYYLKFTTVNLAILRGLYFELTYSGCIRDSSVRRNIITNAIQLIRVTRGRNLIISSSLQKLLEFRSPYDVIHMASVFGLNQALARAAIADNVRKVLHHAEARKNTYKKVVSSTSADQQPAWVADALSDSRDAPTTIAESRKRKIIDDEVK